MWTEIELNRWAKLELDETPHNHIYVNVSTVQLIDPLCREVTMVSGLRFRVTKESIKVLVESTGFRKE